jgi:hypothetical protein
MDLYTDEIRLALSKPHHEFISESKVLYRTLRVHSRTLMTTLIMKIKQKHSNQLMTFSNKNVLKTLFEVPYPPDFTLVLCEDLIC